jgi:hypothetical protein
VRDLLLRAKHLFVAAKRALAGRALHSSNGATVVGNRFREIHLRSRKWPGCRSRLKALMVPNGADIGVYVRGSLVGFSVDQNVGKRDNAVRAARSFGEGRLQPLG